MSNKVRTEIQQEVAKVLFVERDRTTLVGLIEQGLSQNDVVFEKTMKLYCQLYILAKKTTSKEEDCSVSGPEMTEKVLELLVDKLANAERYSGDFETDAYREVILSNLQNVLKHGGGWQSNFASQLQQLLMSRLDSFEAALKLQIISHSLLAGSKQAL